VSLTINRPGNKFTAIFPENTGHILRCIRGCRVIAVSVTDIIQTVPMGAVR